MNITIVSPIFPPDIGGPASYAPSLASKLAKKDSINIVTFCSQRPQQLSLCDVYWVRLFNNSFFRQIALLLTVLRASWKSNLIYSQGTLTVGLVSALVAKLLNKQFYLKFVGDEVWESSKSDQTLEDYYRSVTETLQIKLHRWVLSQASIITPSKYLKNFLVNTHGVSKSKIQVIYNPVEISAVTTLKKPKQIIFVGRLVLWKRVTTLITAMKELKEFDWHLVIVGTGPELNTLQTLTSKLNLDQKISFLGRLSKNDTAKKISESEVLVLLSDYEGQSHVLIESMILGTSVVTRDIEANRELLKNNATYISSLDPIAIAQAIREPQKISRKIQKRFSERHSWKKHLELLVEYFRANDEK